MGRIKILSLVCMLGMDCENPTVVDATVASYVPPKVGGIELVKLGKNSNFLKKCKMVISVKIRKFSRYRMTKQTSPLELSREI